MYADNLSLFFQFTLLALVLMLPSSRFTDMTQAQAQAQENGNRSILLCLCLCLRRCVIRVNRDDGSIRQAQAQGAYACVAPVYT